MLMMLVSWAEAYTVEKSKVAILVAKKEIGLEVCAVETKYMVMSRNKHAGQNHFIHIKVNGLKEWNR